MKKENLENYFFTMWKGKGAHTYSLDAPTLLYAQRRRIYTVLSIMH
jgi:hypothetical protein